MNIYSGKIDITASDDCLNAANSDLGDYAFVMNIMGGTINACSSEGDGFDSNGTLTISGGNIAVWTANTADNQPLDADGLITITGGTILAAGGSSGMDCSISAEQPYVTYGGSGKSWVWPQKQGCPSAMLTARPCTRQQRCAARFCVLLQPGTHRWSHLYPYSRQQRDRRRRCPDRGSRCRDVRGPRRWAGTRQWPGSGRWPDAPGGPGGHHPAGQRAGSGRRAAPTEAGH